MDSESKKSYSLRRNLHWQGSSLPTKILDGMRLSSCKIGLKLITELASTIQKNLNPDSIQSGPTRRHRRPTSRQGPVL